MCLGWVCQAGIYSPTIDPQKEVDFGELGYRVGYRPYLGVESLKSKEKRLICTPLVINELWRFLGYRRNSLIYSEELLKFFPLIFGRLRKCS